MKTSDFDYVLPEELIAQTPVEPRDHSRLLVYSREDQSIQHLHFYDLPNFLRKGDVLVVNETKVIPARLLGEKEETGVPVEILLLKRLEKDVWEGLVRPGRRLKPGTFCTFGNGLLRAEIIDNAPDGGRKVRFHYNGVFEEILDQLGWKPLSWKVLCPGRLSKCSGKAGRRSTGNGRRKCSPEYTEEDMAHCGCVFF